jgi:type VI protein secretion system component VasF
MYSADDMQALNEAFQDEPTQPSTGTRPQPKKEKVNQWTYGQVPEFDPTMTGASQRNTQLAYARKLLAAVMEAACQLETVVENLEQMPQDPSASNPENQTANTVETPEEEDCSGTEPNKRDSYQ